MERIFLWQKLCRMEARRLALAVAITGTVVLVFQVFTIPYGNALLSLFPDTAVKVPILKTLKNRLGIEVSFPNPMGFGEFTPLNASKNSTESSIFAGGLKEATESIHTGKEIALFQGSLADSTSDSNAKFQEIKEAEGKVTDPRNEFTSGKVRDQNQSFLVHPHALPTVAPINETIPGKSDHNENDSYVSSIGKQTTGMLSEASNPGILPSGFTILNNNSALASGPTNSIDSVFATELEEATEIIHTGEEIALFQGSLADSISDSNVKLQEIKEAEEKVKDPGKEFASEKVGDQNKSFPIHPLALPTAAPINETIPKKSDHEVSASNISSIGKQTTGTLSDARTPGILQSGFAILNNDSAVDTMHLRKEKRAMPRMSIPEMDLLLSRNRKSLSMKPQWSSPHDRLLLSAKTQIENAPLVRNDRDLYAPIFRNVSTFKRSYDLMERIFKVYVYKEGERPIFHQPLLDGIYASEGWFMKLMEGNKQFAVRNPRQAHMFYLPFGSRLLRLALYSPGSHDRRYLAAFLKNYVDMIAAKYPFWNRTSGADHFLVACHDWAPYLTRRRLDLQKYTIRALCNADLSEGFKLGKDVSLPETYVRSMQNPLKDLGGKPVSRRHILAFYAGNMHGYLRPILLNHWENKDPSMKIYGRMSREVRHKMTYIEHMKSSKYCLCPRGYEVNSPRVVEAIFYECVPVIISDNFVPPFFEVLNWDEFSVNVAEKDIPNLKEILLSIPEARYHSMQQSVKRVQRHFLWHNKPVKYDIFHMILHSIWFNRLSQVRA